MYAIRKYSNANFPLVQIDYFAVRDSLDDQDGFVDLPDHNERTPDEYFYGGDPSLFDWENDISESHSSENSPNRSPF